MSSCEVERARRGRGESRLNDDGSLLLEGAPVR
jgi:hypothetical protein